ncbi:UNVERIFIED_CONTAM: Cyclic nucleotide-gated ion channel 2 [Sesamum radiatum]|uniref:Cyclic nucleotide-gated ion channel 2 n=1 Tax=Sesamum radiatum TaxID=300843 RepID=A0AAW2V1I4_SESRA
MLFTSHVQTAMSRLIGKLFRRSDDDFTEYPTDCYACTQVGVPVFHSTTCDPVQKPEWEASAGSSLVPIASRSSRNSAAARNRRLIVDPRSTNVQRWNRLIVLARGVALATDPLYFLFISVSGGGGGRPCIYMDGGVATLATVVRTCVDLVHMCHLLVRFRLAYVSRESLVVGCGKLVRDPRAIASHYLLSANGFWFDVFVVLPIPQATYWLLVPVLLRENRIEEMTIILQLTFLVQFLPKVYHCYCLMRGMRKVTGYIFGSIWWGFCLNLIAYFLASNASGGYWYILAVQRIASCLTQQCDTRSCNVPLSCSIEACHPTYTNPHGNNSTIVAKTPLCLDSQGPFPYGIYQFALPLMSTDSFTTKILYSNLWGLMALSTMGNNLEPTSQCLEVLFSICMVLAGLLLFTLLIGNIQVPLFHNLDDLVLDNICDRIKPLLYSKDEKIIREGDLVQRMVFIVCGRVSRSQGLVRGKVATSILAAGSFLGDELISWCLRRPFLDRLPSSSATFTCTQSTEAFALEADDLQYITDHFRYHFANESLKWTARYYSSNWRMWAAINIQLAWRRYVRRTRCGVVDSVLENGGGDGDHRLRKYAAMFLSLRPHDHLE